MKTVITIERATLKRLADRLEFRTPEPTRADRIEPNQRAVNKRIAMDRALIQEVRELLNPNPLNEDFGAWTLEDMRMGREVALHNGNTLRAFALATAIDRKRGLFTEHAFPNEPRQNPQGKTPLGGNSGRPRTRRGQP